MSEPEDMVAQENFGPEVFISYSRDDIKAVRPIIDAIKNAGFDVWWDELLEGGVRFNRVTEEALENASAVVVLWSKTSVASHWVHDEATRGRDRRCLVPLSIDGSEPPLGFRQFQFIDLSRAGAKPGSPEMQKMLQAIGALVHKPAILPETGVSVRRQIDRRHLLAGGAALVAVGGGVALWGSGIFSDMSTERRIAVLPFVNLTGDPEQTYFSDGMASEIRSELSRNPLLQVMGQASSNSFRNHEGDVRSIAARLGVTFLLDGNVQRSRDRVKIAIDLTNGETGLSQWAETFERPIVDIFALQTEIATAVASALSLQIDGDSVDNEKMHVGGTESVVAFDVFLRGQDIFASHIDEVSERKALAMFERAIAIDSSYAAARAGRSRSLAVIANQYADREERERLYGEAVEEATQATRIAPEFAAGFSALGYALFYGRLDVGGARAPFERAYELAQDNVDVFSSCAIYWARVGEFDKANAAIERASQLDPLNASIFKSAGVIKYAETRYDEAIEYALKALEINPERNSVNGDIGNAYLVQNRLDDAKIAYAKEKNNLISLPGRAMIARRERQDKEAQILFDELVREYGDNGLYQQAQILAQWGEKDAAFATLDRARAEGDSGLVYLLNDPFLETLRSEEKYKTLLSKLNFI
ncbi:TIR domain-containing protein [Parasphingorhabdus sp.]|uniref:TIR domain-containing protein n=1 Tax=Parasphingorhabdus sp. TaxID=2709688 RepID=UPI0032655728